MNLERPRIGGREDLLQNRASGQVCGRTSARAYAAVRELAGLFKLRIGVVIAITAWAGLAVTPGPKPAWWQSLVLILAVLVSSAAAGAFNQYYEYDVDRAMARTANRPFASGRLTRHWSWVGVIIALTLASVAAATLATNWMAALYTFLGSFVYAVVYTVWLKRRTWLNIVIGGLAGSFAVLAGAAAVTPALSSEAILLAVVLFLWTPPHFWSLAIAFRDDYVRANVPMLPVARGSHRTMTPLAHRLLNDYQHRFPLLSAPFARIACDTDASENEVFATLVMLEAGGYLSRIGPVFRPNTIGASTLAAFQVPPADLDRVAGIVTACEGVDHNYEREHAVNLWFVVTAPNALDLDISLRELEERAGYPLLRLRLVEPYYIDLGFDIEDPGRTVKRMALGGESEVVCLSDADRRLVGVLQDGLPLAEHPYESVAARTGMTEADVIERIDQWLRDGIIQRFGVIVRHRALGYTANAMAVWNVPDDRVTRIGTLLARAPRVTLCYRRTRALPDWPYNLYCMVHGRERDEVRAVLAKLNRQFDLEQFEQSILFRSREFKQTGARYGPNAEERRALH